MELPRRPKNDVFLRDGTLRQTIDALRQCRGAHDLRIGIVYAFDFRTRMLPYWYSDKRMAPSSVRTLADVLDACGFRHIRIVLQQWTPNFRPSMAELDGKPLDVFMVSAMQVHAEPAYELIRDAHQVGASRPLVLGGGPKAIYEPTDFLTLGRSSGIGADCAITGEAFVLLDLLKVVLEQRAANETIRAAFDRARKSAALDTVPGLVYLAPDSSPDEPVAVNTGMQRLVRDLDEMPLPDAGYRLLEPPHRGRRLRKRPMSVRRVRGRTPIASLLNTQGCKFNCSFCPIPAVNQRTWRHKSPQRFAAEIKHLYETFGLKRFFGTDDNFFNNRDTVVTLMAELAATTSNGHRLGSRIEFYTEATQFDVHRNQDILPLCHAAGLRAIWFGLEDITGELVNKGQTPGKTAQLFARMRKIGIEPMAMMIHNDAQPLLSRHGDLSGVVNQARYLFDKGAVSYQCTYLGPAIGTRSLEPALQSGTVFKAVGGQSIPQAFYDGNHVVASEDARPWRRQLNVLAAYMTFYNPYNMLRTLVGLRRNSVSAKRLLFQIIGQIGLVMTVPKLARWAWRLYRGPIEKYHSRSQARVPMIDALTRKPMSWAIERAQPEGPSINAQSADVSRRVDVGRRARTTSLPILQPI